MASIILGIVFAVSLSSNLIETMFATPVHRMDLRYDVAAGDITLWWSYTY